VDIAKIVVAFSDAEVRRDVEESLLDEYYAHLKKGIEERGRKVELSFGIEELRELYELQKISSSMGIIAFLSFIPIVAKDRIPPRAMEALLAKILLRAKFALVDALDSLEKYAPQFLAE
jgi:hypothetical protein